MTLHNVVLFVVALFLMLATGLLCGRAMKLVRMPVVLGELLGGILLGPTVFGSVAPELCVRFFPAAGAVVTARDAFVQVCLLCFLFAAGVEMKVPRGEHLGRKLTLICACGTLIPFVVGFVVVVAASTAFVAHSQMKPMHTAIFMGTALSISSVPVIARILMELGQLRSPLGSLIVSSATIIDLVSLTAFSALLLAYAPSAVSTWIAVNAILVALVAGVLLSKRIEAKPRALGAVRSAASHLCAPIYFVSIGLKVDVADNIDAGLVVIVFIIACIGKIVGGTLGGYFAKMPWRESLAVGFGLNARGAMGMIIASVALAYRLIDAKLFVALVVMAIATSVMSGPAIARLCASSVVPSLR